MRFCIFVIIVVSISHAIAQKNTITGHTQNIETGQPIESVHIFIANTTIGTTTNEKGNFTLDNLSSGEFDLVASFVGYEFYVMRIQLVADKTIHILIQMTPKLVQLDEVEVSVKKDRTWQRLVKRFSREFFGSGSNARQCKILNPWVIDFEYDKIDGLYIAKSDNHIEVLNEALGYKIFFYLKHFKWKSGYISYFVYPRFEELEADSKEKEEEWELNRKSAYEGSLRHMFYAIVNNCVEKEGFRIYQYNKLLGRYSINPTIGTNLADLVGKQLLDFDPAKVLIHSIDSRHLLIDYDGTLEVIYKKIRWQYSPYPDAPYQVSTIKFFRPVRCTEQGYVFDQINYEVSGYLILSRIANMLPFEYGLDR